MSSSICPHCSCQNSWNSNRYKSCDDCRLQQRRNRSNKYQNNLNLPAATPSPSTTETVIAASIAGSQSNFRALEESRPVIATSITDSQSNFQEFEKNQPSNIKHHRLNTNSSHNGKIFLRGNFWSRLSNLTGATPSSSTTGPAITTSIAGSQNNFQALEESQASNVKRRRLNDSHRGKIFFWGNF